MLEETKRNERFGRIQWQRGKERNSSGKKKKRSIFMLKDSANRCKMLSSSLERMFLLPETTVQNLFFYHPGSALEPDIVA